MVLTNTTIITTTYRKIISKGTPLTDPHQDIIILVPITTGANLVIKQAIIDIQMVMPTMSEMGKQAAGYFLTITTLPERKTPNLN